MSYVFAVECILFVAFMSRVQCVHVVYSSAAQSIACLLEFFVAVYLLYWIDLLHRIA